MASSESLLLLTCLWLSYFAMHSWFASLRLKRWVARRYPWLAPWYRIIYNSLATLLILPPLYMMWSLGGEPLWQWDGLTAWLAYSLASLAIIAFFWSLKYYDGSEFLGLRQLRLRIHDVRDQEQFHISPLHRFVRHPWYSLGLVIIWTQEMDPARLVSALAMTIYFLGGSILEERKLLVYHGKVYRIYREKVPGLVPRPWRYLRRKQAEELLRLDLHQRADKSRPHASSN